MQYLVSEINSTIPAVQLLQGCCLLRPAYATYFRDTPRDGKCRKVTSQHFISLPALGPPEGMSDGPHAMAPDGTVWPARNSAEPLLSIMLGFVRRV